MQNVKKKFLNSGRIFYSRIQIVPFNLLVNNVYAPTAEAQEKVNEEWYEEKIVNSRVIGVTEQ